jgi:enoyl-CoA hydratase/carnithine racemase
MKMSKVNIDVDDRKGLGRIIRVTYDNQKKLNCIGLKMVEELAEVFTRFQVDTELRCIVLTGAGEQAFIGGVDINELIGMNPQSAEAFITCLHGLCQAIRDVPVPVIARISGYCLGGGLEVAAACDLRVAAEGSTFGMPEVRVGIPSVIEAALLPRLIGWGKTSELVYTGRSMPADEALRWGLVEQVVSANELDRATDNLVEAIINSGPRAIRLQKALLRKWETLPLDKAVEAGIQSLRQAYETVEPKVFMQRFLNRKKNKD